MIVSWSWQFQCEELQGKLNRMTEAWLGDQHQLESLLQENVKLRSQIEYERHVKNCSK